MRIISTCWIFLMTVSPAALADDQPNNSSPVASPTSQAKKADDQGWISMLDGQSLRGWEVVKDIDYENSGKIVVKDQWLILEAGQPATGVRWKKPFPKSGYEVKLETARLNGDDFFCGMTFPVGSEAATLILGGWGGSVVGLSNIDGYSAVENQTTQGFDFKKDQWYRVHLRVTDDRVQVWLDDEQIIDFERREHKLSVRWEVEACLPFGFATWHTTGGLRKIQYRRLVRAPNKTAPNSDN